MSSEAGPILAIGGWEIRPDGPPYLIAEVGVNHEGSLDTAMMMIDQIAEAGAQAVKFQAYKAHTLAAKDSPSYWDLNQEPTKSQHELFKKYDAFGPEEYVKLAQHCGQVGLDFVCTPFDLEAVDFLDPLVPCFKVASADITNPPLLRRVAAKGKPVLLSVGAATIEEIREGAAELARAGCRELCLLHCVLNYPTRFEDANLNMIAGLAQEFPGLSVGYSDHTFPDQAMSAVTTAYLKGALIIEKHFTHDKNLPGNDHYHAMDLGDLKRLRAILDRIGLMAGRTEKTPLPSEQPARINARRSLVLTRALEAGQVIAEADLTCKRPGSGIPAANYDEVIGALASRDLPLDHVLDWGDIKRDAAGSQKVVAVIQARMGSSRFPGKMTATLAGHRLIDWVLCRAARCQETDEVVLALPRSEENDVLAQAAESYHLAVIRGSERDVLHRSLSAARQARADVIVRICADNPFIDPGEIDRLISFFKEERPDYAFNHLNRLENNYPDGLGAEILGRGLLEELAVRATDPRHREHVTLALWEEAGGRRMETFPARPQIAHPRLKLDVDFPEDLAALEAHLKRALDLSGPLSDPTLITADQLLAPYGSES